MSELGLIIHKLNEACCPEEIFGASDLASSYKKLARVCHPDVNKDPLAEQAFGWRRWPSDQSSRLPARLGMAGTRLQESGCCKPPDSGSHGRTRTNGSG